MTENEYHWSGVPMDVLRGRLTQEEFDMKLALDKPDGEPLKDVSELEEDTKKTLRLINHTMDKIEGGEGQGPACELFERALSLLFGSEGRTEILSDPDREQENDELKELKASDLERVEPDMAMMSLSGHVDKLFRDGRCSRQERDQQRRRMSTDRRDVQAFVHSRQLVPEGTFRDGGDAAQAEAESLVDEVYARSVSSPSAEQAEADAVVDEIFGVAR